MDMAHYLLNPRYRLRGWDLLPFALYDAQTWEATFLDRDRFPLLSHFDGLPEIDRGALDEGRQTWIDELLREGIVSECSPGAMLEPRQMYRSYPCRYKHSVHWAITGACNFRCKHCLVSAPHAKFGNPTTEQLLFLIDQMADCGIAAVTITGGEPLIRPDFWQIVDALVSRDIAAAGSSWSSKARLQSSTSAGGWTPAAR